MKTIKVVEEFTWSNNVIEYTWHYAKVLNNDNTTTLTRVIDNEEKYSICKETGLPIRNFKQLYSLRTYASMALKAVGFFSSKEDKPFYRVVSIQVNSFNEIYWVDVIYETPTKTLIFNKKPENWSPEELDGRWKYLAVGNKKSTNGKLKSICDHLMCR